MFSLLPYTIVDLDCGIDFNFSFRFLLDVFFLSISNIVTLLRSLLAR